MKLWFPRSGALPPKVANRPVSVLSATQEPVLYDGNIQAFFDFKTRTAFAVATSSWCRDKGGFIAQTLQTQANGLQDFPEVTRHNRRRASTMGS